MKHKYLLMDGRARFDINTATVLQVEDTEAQARKVIRDGDQDGFDPVIVRADENEDVLTNLVVLP